VEDARAVREIKERHCRLLVHTAIAGQQTAHDGRHLQSVEDDTYVVGICFKKRAELQSNYTEQLTMKDPASSSLSAAAAEAAAAALAVAKVRAVEVLRMNASDELVLAPMGLFYPEVFHLSSGTGSSAGEGRDASGGDIGRVRRMRSHAWIDNDPDVWKSYGINFDNAEDCFDHKFLASTAKSDKGKEGKDGKSSSLDSKNNSKASGSGAKGGSKVASSDSKGSGQGKNKREGAAAAGSKASLLIGSDVRGENDGDTSGKWSLSQSKLLPGGAEQQDEGFGSTPLLGIGHAVCLSLTRARQELKAKVMRFTF
jgi:hypothetical protein